MTTSGLRMALLGLLVATSAAANDTTAVLSTGGLEFVRNENVEMLSEELFISTEEIRVTYAFRNNGSEDESVLVAFPMPDITPNHWSPVSYPDGPEDNLFRFETTFDGEPVEAELHQYAFAAGVDRSELLRGMGLPLAPFTDAAREATDALSDEETAELFHLGLVVPDEYDAGNGWEKHWWPSWTLRSTYTWEAEFPAGKTVEVVHRYKPSVGGTVAASFLIEPYEDYDPRAEYTKKYCLEDDFVSAVEKTITPEAPYGPYSEQWLSYVLTTGANWGGPIGEFKLIVDKGDPKNLVSFCGENVRKTGPTTFEMVEKDFYPQKDLEILILVHNESVN